MAWQVENGGVREEECEEWRKKGRTEIRKEGMKKGGRDGKR